MRGRIEVSLKGVTIVRDERGWQSSGDVTHRKCAEVGENLNKVRELKTRHQTRRFDFWGSLMRDKFACHGCCTRWWPNEEANIKRLCLSPCVETFNSVNKKVSYLNKEVVTCFQISRFLCSLYVLLFYFAHGVNCGYSTLVGIYIYIYICFVFYKNNNLSH